MKNKKLLYILVPSFILVWGLVVLRIINFFGPEEGTVLRNNKSFVTKNDTVIKTDFKLIASYADPFLKDNKQLHTSPVLRSAPADLPVRSDARTMIASPPAKKAVSWPAINYGGIIVNKKNERKTALLSINNSQFIVSPGNTLQSITIEAVYPDSIKLIYGEEAKTFIKAEFKMPVQEESFSRHQGGI